jgi:iron-sulfur cluster repair protein YtfE (RIC family)
LKPMGQTCRRLHEEHQAVFELLRRFSRALSEAAPGVTPELSEPAWAGLLREVRGGLEGEVTRHFAFEERSLFPLLDDAGEGDLREMFLEDHATVRGIATQLLDLIASAQAQAPSRAAWATLKRLGLALCDALSEHALKEEQALLPALDNILSEEQDRELFAAYAGGDAVAH